MKFNQKLIFNVYVCSILTFIVLFKKSEKVTALNYKAMYNVEHFHKILEGGIVVNFLL